MRRWTPFVLVALLVPMWSWATVQEQRARLPDPVDECADDVGGTWLAHVFYPHVQEWYIFTLQVELTDDAVSGTLQSHFWHADGTDSAVPPCSSETRYPLSVVQPVTGRYADGELVVHATSWNNGGPSCHPLRANGYMLDNFSGPVDATTQEWSSVLDAASPLWTNVPTLFRRIACPGDALEVVEEVAELPPFAPPSRGCDWW